MFYPALIVLLVGSRALALPFPLFFAAPRDLGALPTQATTKYVGSIAVTPAPQRREADLFFEPELSSIYRSEIQARAAKIERPSDLKAFSAVPTPGPNAHIIEKRETATRTMAPLAPSVALNDAVLEYQEKAKDMLAELQENEDEKRGAPTATTTSPGHIPSHAHRERKEMDRVVRDLLSRSATSRATSRDTPVLDAMIRLECLWKKREGEELDEECREVLKGQERSRRLADRATSRDTPVLDAMIRLECLWKEREGEELDEECREVLKGQERSRRRPRPDGEELKEPWPETKRQAKGKVETEVETNVEFKKKDDELPGYCVPVIKQIVGLFGDKCKG